jgi:threonine/homoserine/homoserine lactone efflux protein
MLISLSFLLTCLIIEATPGPNMTYLALLRITEGRVAAFSAVAGVALGLLVLGLMASAGFGEMVANSPQIYSALRWAGAAYLFWLAWDAWRDAAAPEIQRAQSRLLYFRRGLITNLLNPKAAIFYVTILPGFLKPGHGALESLSLTVSYVAIATLVHVGVVLLAGTIKPDPALSTTIRRIFSLALGAIAVWFFMGTANP